QDDMSVMFITHDMGVVAEISDRTVVMYHGNAVEEGPTSQIFSSPQAPYTRALLAAVPRLGSMRGLQDSLRFPVVSKKTGLAEPVPASVPTVDPAAKPILEVRNLVTRFDI